MADRGRWSGRRQYRAGDVVTVSGRAWVALVDNSNVIPGTNMGIWGVAGESSSDDILRQGSNQLISAQDAPPLLPAPDPRPNPCDPLRPGEGWCQGTISLDALLVANSEFDPNNVAGSPSGTWTTYWDMSVDVVFEARCMTQQQVVEDHEKWFSGDNSNPARWCGGSEEPVDPPRPGGYTGGLGLPGGWAWDNFCFTPGQCWDGLGGERGRPITGFAIGAFSEPSRCSYGRNFLWKRDLGRCTCPGISSVAASSESRTLIITPSCGPCYSSYPNFNKDGTRCFDLGRSPAGYLNGVMFDMIDKITDENFHTNSCCEDSPLSEPDLQDVPGRNIDDILLEILQVLPPEWT